MKKIMVSAGEVSGDFHGLYLVRELKKLLPDAYFFGMGSERLLSEGVDIRYDISQLGTIGIFEALPNLIPIYFIYLKLLSLLKKERPDLLILIDSQGINLPLAKAAKKLGIKTVYYIAPQEWLWGTPRGVKKAASSVGLIISIFEKEYQIYKSANANVVYHGHPLIDILAPYSSKEASEKLLKNKGFVFDSRWKHPVVALCPGSRTQELKSLLPILLKSAELIKRSFPEATFILPAASANIIKNIFSLVRDFRPRAIVGVTHEILSLSDLAICASGTINLEASLLGIPNIMVYKLSPLTVFLGKFILKIDKKLPFYSMPNILLGEKVLPELIMREASPSRISDEAILILKDDLRRQKYFGSFSRLKRQLGSPGVIQRCAKSIVDFSLS